MEDKKISEFTELLTPTGTDELPIVNTGETKKILFQKIIDYFASLFVAKNANITGSQKTKITYDAKGLVTSGTDATTADINDSTNRRYVTDANLTVIGNTSGTNTGDETQSTIESKLGFASVTANTIAFFNATKNLISGTGATLGTFFQTFTAKSTPIDNDTIIVNDSATSFEAKKTTLTQFKAFLKTYFDTLYGSAFSGTIGNIPFFNTTNPIEPEIFIISLFII